MVAVLRAVVICASGVPLAQALGGEEMQHHAAKRHSHHHYHSADDGSGRLTAGGGSNMKDIQITIEAKGGIKTLARREAAEEDATEPFPRPFSLVEQEPHVSCGRHNAPECAACNLDHGADWCHGDCHWDEESSTCMYNHERTRETSTSDQPISDDEQDSDEAIAARLRREQEAAEEQARIDRNKFWLTVGIAACSSACLVMACGVFAICVMKSRHDALKAIGPRGGAAKMLEEKESEVMEPEVMEDEMFTVVANSADIYDSCEGDEKIGTLSKDDLVYAAGPPVQGRLPIKAPSGATGAVEMNALQKQEEDFDEAAGWEEGEEKQEVDS